MTRFHATSEGDIPFTIEEESEYDTRKIAWAVGAIDRKVAQVRAQRDAKLLATDWRVIKAMESNQLQNFAWVAYRQELRDITLQPGFPDDVTWPVEP